MSDPQVTHVERADVVEHADDTEQAQNVTNAEHVETVDNLDLHVDSVGSNKLRSLKTVRDVVLLTVALVSMAALILVFVRADSQDNENAALITSLRAELATSAAAVEATRASDAERVECVTRFTYAIQLAEGEIISAQSALVTAIATAAPDTPERQTAAADALVRLGEAQAAYDTTVQKRIDYDIAGNPPPCPLPPGLNEE